MKFDKVVVIGSNKIAVECVKVLFDEYKIEELFVIENSNNNMSMLEYICSKKKIDYTFNNNKSDLDVLLRELSFQKKLLIISANNNYIFNKEIVEKHTVINFHYSYLPNYRGVNIPSWVIYNQEQYTGVSWHYVNNKIDDGAIIKQVKFMILPDDRAIDIVKKGMNLGVELFKQFIGEILDGKDLVTVENKAKKILMYSHKNLPDNGVLNLENNGRKIYATLRAYDYDNINIFPRLFVEWGKKRFLVKCYTINKIERVNNNQIKLENEKLIIEKDNLKIEIVLEEQL